ncbi:MAG: 3'-5' exonuclease, partial [Methylococcaceae bacterium]|nr:3'-5' exonuclease [Methylococcaceae bacterium]
TLRQLINDYGLHARLTEANDGERCLTNLLHLAELLQQASGQLDGEQALIRHLAEEIAATDQAAEESVIRLESDANLIKIITIHKSKGLEYPLVFLPFICSFREVSGRHNSFYRYHDADQQLSIDLSKSDETMLVRDKERLQEDLRLLYVAITRARYACWLGVAAIKVGNTKDSQLDKSAIGYLLGWQPKTSATALGDHLAQLKGECADIAIAKLPEPGFDLYRPKQQLEQHDATCIATTKIAENWWIASYSALQTDNKQQIQSTAADTAHDDKQTDEADSYLGPVATLSGIHSLPRGSGPGVLIHELLEQAAFFGFQTVPEQSLNRIFIHTSWDDKRTIIAETLTKWLKMPLLEGTGLALANLGSDQYQAELEFMIGANNVDVQALDQLITQHTFGGKPRPRLLATQVNGLLKGFIDLVFVHNRQYYVADYKFNALGNNDAAYTAEALETAMLSKRYDVQFALYLLALHRLLKVRLGASYDYDTHIGGGLYLFLRGWQGPTGGRAFNKPPRKMIEALDKLFAGNGANA